MQIDFDRREKLEIMEYLRALKEYQPCPVNAYELLPCNLAEKIERIFISAGIDPEVLTILTALYEIKGVARALCGVENTKEVYKVLWKNLKEIADSLLERWEQEQPECILTEWWE